MPQTPFSALEPTPRSHFKLYFYAAVLRVLAQVSQSLGSLEAVFEQFPFLVGYSEELAAFGLERIFSRTLARISFRRGRLERVAGRMGMTFNP